MKFLTILIFYFFCSIVFGQKTAQDSIARKILNTVKTTSSPKIDGILDDEVWKNAPVANNFIQKDPENGKPEDPAFRTEVKILYDDTGIYFGIKLYDPEPAKISKELTERDNIGNDDYFNILINGYNDKQQSLEFFLMPTGVQFDAKLNLDGTEDANWSAVWYSAAKISNDGWSIEMKIPYSELRFPKKDIQQWGINFIRYIRRTKVKTSWNFIDNKKGGTTLYDGVLNGIGNIKTPVRLSFLPYFSTYISRFDGANSARINGGMDVKYGINEAFTLDTTLIPDFGQTAFDDNTLNLGPFEQQFTEKRSFFTEGTELFSKGNLFYSRRVGDYPSRSPDLGADESLVDNIQKVKLYNATKISGRTNKGLGIGFFNALTEKNKVEIKNELNGNIRQEIIEPIANYNVLVLDQRFNGNSSVSFINTNVMRAGNFRDANATAFLLDVKDKKNKYKLSGGFKGSLVNEYSKIFGTDITAGISKIFGKSRYGLSGEAISKNYNIDDLGYTGETNFINAHANYGYRLLQPNKNFNSIFWNIDINYARRIDTDLFKAFTFHTDFSLLNKKFETFGGGLLSEPFGTNDLYEPRTFGKYLFIGGYVNPFLYFSSDNRKKFTYYASVDYYIYFQKEIERINTELDLGYRLSDYFSVDYIGNYNISNYEKGFVANQNSNIIIGTRDRSTVINSISSKYTLNNRMSFTFSLRYYYSEVNYRKFGTLQNDGSVSDTNNFKANNQTYNSFNVDLRYSWWFAPGSQITLLYQNAAQDYLNYSRINFRNNFRNLFNDPMSNTLSLKLTYFIDYNSVRNILK
ncbi:DUF5916 domain-containing protein [Halpernia frigidisoli]|uniref:Carbohydrate family 9 binding domain-like n=1 Tax=Halpernia frigidisoli TaxID=1125876 RepID=A0A1I3FAR7_9FLAO|nr:DUF5916 domain-containing protein [Halpernia frigidisoli]SFI08284.1 Carbohydrate family 9 binding domain-like [Halpernia frigidisoli]